MSARWVSTRVRRGLLPLFIAFAECAWLSFWGGLVATWSGLPAAAVPFTLVFGSIALGAVVADTSSRIASRRIRGGVVAAFGIVAVLLVTRLTAFLAVPFGDLSWLREVANRPLQIWSGMGPIDLALVVGIVGWLRGTAIGRRVRAFDEVRGTFAFGFGVLSAGLIAEAVAPGASATVNSAGVAVVVFLGAGLASVALARVEDVNAEQRRNRDAELGPGAHWVATLGVAIVLLLGLALLLSASISFDLIMAILRPIGAALDTLIEVLIFVIAVPIAYLIQFLLLLLRPRTGRPPTQPRLLRLDDLARLLNANHAGSALPPYVETILRYLAGALVVALVVVLLYRAVNWWTSTERDDDVPETRDFVVRWSEVRAEIWRWLRGIFRRARSHEAAVLAADSAHGSDELDDRTIRGIYRQYLLVGARIGLRRAGGETPYEYERRMGAEHPPARAAIDRVTGAYVAARYGEEHVGEATLRECRSALGQIRDTVDRIISNVAQDSC